VVGQGEGDNGGETSMASVMGDGNRKEGEDARWLHGAEGR
jgi:hypothetical protein